MSNLINDLELAKSIIERTRDCSKFDCIYPFTNENLVGAFKKFNFKNKSCLTVLGSSDQALDMYLKGAKKIDTFDINPLAYYYFHLKKAALISNISKNEFISFFYADDDCFENMLYYNIFSRITSNLSNESFIFWNELYDKYTPSKIRQTLFLSDIPDEHNLSKMINYLKGKNYDMLKDKIKDLDITFLNLNATELPENLTQSYDFIYLSNIMQYANYIYKTFGIDCTEAYKKYKNLVLQLSNSLNKGGQMDICYFFNGTSIGLMSLKNILKDIFFEDVFKLYNFRSKEFPGVKNAILTYKKHN